MNCYSVPVSVWRINLDAPEEGKNVSLDNAEDRWWDQVDLTKLIMASNLLTTIPDDIAQLSALVILDVRYCYMTKLIAHSARVHC